MTVTVDRGSFRHWGLSAMTKNTYLPSVAACWCSGLRPSVAPKESVPFTLIWPVALSMEKKARSVLYVLAPSTISVSVVRGVVQPSRSSSTNRSYESVSSLGSTATTACTHGRYRLAVLSGTLLV